MTQRIAIVKIVERKEIFFSALQKKVWRTTVRPSQGATEFRPSSCICICALRLGKLR